ncbi:F-box/WD repeat-containing protein 7-like [Patiria miniata]|uniref:F-box domain-containing protein n=1 Tax=Patiria miniata TaxID=46514 RepID=A0A913Z7Z0_PATMI|nr:F-box/WD repeat-containing protein 7-like [Patiria miniata]XP_038047843.1 F-box/WD repeat-containing protein 7-like [Patiria miniata]
MEQPVQILHPHHGEGDCLAPHQGDVSSGPIIGASLMGQWHAFKGRPIENELDMEFHRQLDHVAVWIDRWGHQQKCLILEGILTRSNYSQFGFLWTCLQPALHRDFMYTSQQLYPEHRFTPISTFVSRETRARRAVRNYYHVGSAHLQRRSDVIRCNTDTGPVHSEDMPVTRQGRQSEKTTLSGGPQLSRSTANIKLPSIHSTRYHSSRNANPLSRSAPASLKRITDEAPAVRRHMQDRPRPNAPSAIPKDYSPVTAQNLPHLTKSLTQIQISRTRPTMSGTSPRNLPPVPIVPDEAWQLYHWYEECWNDVQRNEFLHKLLKRLDSRQLYFLCSSLALKQSRDFIALLPESLALRILQYLSPKSLLVAALVSRTWCRLASHDSIWKAKCDQVDIEIPLPSGHFLWKTVYRDNVFLRQNWESGKCKQIDVRGHTAKVLCVTFDGKTRLASGSKDSSIKIWDIHTGNLIQTLKGHTKGVWCLSFFTRYLLVSSSFDGTVKVWNLRSGVCTRTMFGHDGPIWAMAQKGHFLVTASQDRTLKLWDMRTCLLEHTLVGHTQAVFCVDMDDNCTMVISGSADRSIRVWSVETGRYTKVIWASQSTSIMALSYHRGYFTCAVGETVSLWRLETASCIKTFDEHEKRVESVGLRVDNAKDPDSPRGLLVTAGQDGMVKYWNLDSNKSNHTLQSSSQINSLFFDETKIIGACSDYKLKIWDFNTSL